MITLDEFSEIAIRLLRAPFSLAQRPYLTRVYQSRARRLVIRASRQVEKSTFLANRIVYDAFQMPGIQILVVCPRIDQSHQFSHARLQPVINDSPTVRRILWPWKRAMPVEDIYFANGSTVHLKAAFRSADPCRGISADELFVDEFQDLAPGSLSVLLETMSHSSLQRLILTGTPKMIDNDLETYFQQTTACLWRVPCPGCKLSVGLDERTLGPVALICSACRGPLDVRQGAWVASQPEATWGEGFAISHLMVPWLNVHDILERQQTYDRVRFVNEVLGLPVALGDHVITREEVERCCEDRPFASRLSEAPAAAQQQLVAGIDWGGGSVSGTVLVIGYPFGDRGFRVLRFDRWLPHTDPDEVLAGVAQRCREFRIWRIAADGGGNGLVYNRMLVKTLKEMRNRPPLFFSIHYSAETKEPVREGVLWSWTVNRSNTIGGLFTRLKMELTKFPRVSESSSYIDEFTCELMEYDEIMRTARYTKPETARDDALHATNYAELLGRRLSMSP